MDNKTSFEDKCDILGDIWMTYRTQTEFADYLAYNDVGLPLAWATSEAIAQPTDSGRSIIEESFAMFLEILGLEDTGFDTLDDILGNASIE